MRHYFFLWACLSVFFLLAAGSVATAGSTRPAQAPDPPLEEIIQAQRDLLDEERVAELLAGIDADIKPYLPSFSPGQLVARSPVGGIDLDLPLLFQGLMRYLLKEVWANMALLGQLLALAVLCALLGQLRVAGGDETVANLAFAACYLALLILAFRSFTVAVAAGREAVTNTTAFMQSLVPLLAVMLAAAGGVTSAGILHPLIFTSMTALTTLISKVVVPLTLWAVTLGVAEQLLPGFSLKRLAKLLMQCAIFALGLVFTVFLGVMVVRGIVAPLTDSLTLRSGKFAMGNLVPVIGKMLADTVEVVAGCALVVQGGLGLAGVVGLLGFCLFPTLKLVALLFLYRFVAAVLQPVGDERLSAGVDWFGDGLMVLCLTTLSVGLMLFVGLAVLLGAARPLLL